MEPPWRSGGSAEGSPARDLDPAATTKLFVGGIPTVNATTEQIADLFAHHGAPPTEVAMLPARGSNPDTRCAFVRVEEEAALHICQALNGLTFEGCAAPLVVRPAEPRQQQQQQQVEPRPAGVWPQGGSGGHSRAGGGGHSLPRPPPAAPAAPRHVPPPAAAQHRRRPVEDSAAEEAARARAEGRWLDAAEWRDREYAEAGESQDARFQRLCEELQVAVTAQHFYEAAALCEAMAQIDPGRLPAEEEEELTGSFGSGRYVGTILSFTKGRHFGFIQCPELGTDCFLSDKQIGNFQVGDRVSFTVTLNGKGQPQAQGLLAADQPPPVLPPPPQPLKRRRA